MSNIKLYGKYHLELAKTGLNSEVVLISRGLNWEILLYTWTWLICYINKTDQQQNLQLICFVYKTIRIQNSSGPGRSNLTKLLVNEWLDIQTYYM